MERAIHTDRMFLCERAIHTGQWQPMGTYFRQVLFSMTCNLREFVLNSRHPDPRRVSKGGPEGGLRETIRGNPQDPGMNSKRLFLVASMILEHHRPLQKKT